MGVTTINNTQGKKEIALILSIAHRKICQMTFCLGLQNHEETQLASPTTSKSRQLSDYSPLLQSINK